MLQPNWSSTIEIVNKNSILFISWVIVNSKIFIHSKNTWFCFLGSLTFSIKCGWPCLYEFSFWNPSKSTSSFKYTGSMLWDTSRTFGITWPGRIRSWQRYLMCYAQGTFSWTWIFLSSVASGATFDTYSSLANIAWIRSKMSPLLNTKEDLKDSNFNLV